MGCAVGEVCLCRLMDSWDGRLFPTAALSAPMRSTIHISGAPPCPPAAPAGDKL